MARVVLSSSSLAFHTNDATVDDTVYQLCRVHVDDETPGVLFLKGPEAGGVRLRGLAAPTSSTDAVTVQYFDDNKASITKAAVRVATVEGLSTLYESGTVPHTLTGTVDEALVIDDVALSVGDAVLVKDQADGAQNGRYRVAVAGDGSTAFVLERAADFDSAEDVLGAVLVTYEGTVNGNRGFACTCDSTGFVFGTTPITFSSFDLTAASLNDGSVLLQHLGTQTQGSLVTFGETGAASLVTPGTFGHVLGMGPDGVPVFGQIDGAAFAEESITDLAVAPQTLTLSRLALHYGGALLAYDWDGTPVHLDTSESDGLPLVSSGAGGLPIYAQLTTEGIANDAITTANLRTGCVDEFKLDDDAVSHTHIKVDAVRTGHIQAGAVTLDKLHADTGGVLAFSAGVASVVSASFAHHVLMETGGGLAFSAIPLEALDYGTPGGIVSFADTGMPTVVSPSTAGYPLVASMSLVPEYAQLTGTGIASATIGSEHFATGAVDSNALGYAAVTSTAIQSGAVDSSAIGIAVIGPDHLSAQCVGSAALAPLCVDSSHLNGAIIESANIVDGVVLTQHLAADCVTGPLLDDVVHKPTLTSLGRAATLHVSFSDTQLALVVDSSARIVATAAGGSFVGSWTSGSDVKWKDVHGPVTADALGALDAVDGYAWTWTGSGCGQAGTPGFGVTAQDFAQVCPDAVHFDETLGGLVVDYHAVAALNLCAAKALKAENEARVSDLTRVEERVAVLEAALAALAARVGASSV